MNPDEILSSLYSHSDHSIDSLKNIKSENSPLKNKMLNLSDIRSMDNLNSRSLKIKNRKLCTI